MTTDYRTGAQTGPSAENSAATSATRFRLNRAGVLNIWQYDEQEFSFADGRLLLRGANGAGKSKTLEMLLPFALDGDKSKLNASGKHHTSLLWLMTDGYDGPGRVGYVWVEFLRTDALGQTEAFTCGVGIRASSSQRTVTSWHFATDQRVGIDFSLTEDGNPLIRGRLEDVLGEHGYVFERATAYKEHIGRTLFGLEPSAYDEVLRLLYWLRQPQIGEDIEPAKLTSQLSQALPQIDEQALRSAGETFDQIAAFGEQIERQSAAAKVLGELAAAYAGYAQAVLADRARAVAQALRTERQLRSKTKQAEKLVASLAAELADAENQRTAAIAARGQDEARLRTLQDRPEFRDQRRLLELNEAAQRARQHATAAATRLDRAERAAAKLRDSATAQAAQAKTGLQTFVSQVNGLHPRLRQAIPASPGLVLGAALEPGELASPEQLSPIRAALQQARETLVAARQSVGVRLAEVALVRDAMRLADAAGARQREAERVAENAEQRWEAARARLQEAESEADAAYTDFNQRMASWAAQAPSPIEVALPQKWDAESVETALQLPHNAAAATLDDWRREQATAESRRELAEAEMAQLRTRRSEVLAERDPAPPQPPLPRTERRDGLALWQVVDFVADLSSEQRAGLEAALQSAGLLDAWIRPGGRLLDRDDRDVVLAGHQRDSQATSQSPGQHHRSTLAEFLIPDLPEDCDLQVHDVRSVLAAIGTGIGSSTETGETAKAPSPAVWVHTDGSWQLGPALGRASKSTAQYIGATAREQERQRRLAEIDAQLREREELRAAALATIASLSHAITNLVSWVQSVPSGRLLSQAWTRVDERSSEEARAGADNKAAQLQARAARTEATEARELFHQRALEHQLPTDPAELEAAEQSLRGLDAEVADAERRVPAVNTSLDQWADKVELWHESQTTLADEQATAEAASQQADEASAAADSLRDTIGATIEELKAEIAAVKRSMADNEHTATAAEKRGNQLRQQHGGARADASNAHQRLAEHLVEQETKLAALAATAAVPGMLAATGAAESDCDHLARLAQHSAQQAIDSATAAAVAQFAALSDADPAAALNRVWKIHGEATSGPAFDHQPTIAEYADLLAVSGRDEAGEATIVELAERVAKNVRDHRELLTEREKQQFEQHILGELGESIRRCSRDADELVAAMNQQLQQVTTSQGIRVKLDWKLRDDVPDEARQAVQLLSQPIGALTATERASLRDVLHQLIEVSRAEHPELSYRDHLAAALDYRVWSEFFIRYNRPEGEGKWERLHRRSPLSQGEQKVLCYLPLFAAAAAHFTSLAGAAPNAPRLVLLDDAFPKIDVRTHPLLFGLLVQLDLDFVITSERLWGDHPTVPSLAIYEALRDPAVRGIAQYEYRWNGHVMQTLG